MKFGQLIEYITWEIFFKNALYLIPNFLKYLAISFLKLFFVFYPICDAINCEIYLSFLIKPFSKINKNIRTKFSISKKKKKLLGWSKNYSQFLRPFTEANKTNFLGRKESDLAHRCYTSIIPYFAMFNK